MSIRFYFRNLPNLEKSKQTIKKKAPNPSASQVPTKKEVQRAEKYEQEHIKVGSQVQLLQTNRIGIVEEMKGKQLTVIFGQARIKALEMPLSCATSNVKELPGCPIANW